MFGIVIDKNNPIWTNDEQETKAFIHARFDMLKAILEFKRRISMVEVMTAFYVEPTSSATFSLCYRLCIEDKSVLEDMESNMVLLNRWIGDTFDGFIITVDHHKLALL